MDWFLKNMVWIFSGVGTSLFFLVLGFIFKPKNNSQIQKGGKKSTNIQVGTINVNHDK